jgi:hypothetical protein
MPKISVSPAASRNSRKLKLNPITIVDTPEIRGSYRKMRRAPLEMRLVLVSRRRKVSTRQKLP